MRKLGRNVGLVVVTVAALTAPLFASLARADVEVKDMGNGSVRCTMKFRCGGTPVCTPWPTKVLVGPGIQTFGSVCAEQYPPCGIAAIVRYDFGTGTFAPVVYAGGGGSAGGESVNGDQIETLPDSLVAAVGLYIPGGGTGLLNPPPDSILSVGTQRAGTQVTLTINTGGMQVRAFNANETSIAEYKVFVYPDSFAANADINRDGFGASGFGRVVLEAGVGVPTGYSVYGLFNSSDWILQTQPGAKYTLRPNGTITKIVNVPNAATATIVAVGDPRTVSRPVAGPGTSPLGLALLALALMGSGLWVMRSRPRVEAA